jgi:hypothetical protein
VRWHLLAYGEREKALSAPRPIPGGGKQWELSVGAQTRGSRRGTHVLLADLRLLLGRKVVLDVEELANLLGRLALDHVGHRLAADVQQRLDVEVVGREDDLEQHLCEPCGVSTGVHTHFTRCTHPGPPG